MKLRHTLCAGILSALLYAPAVGSATIPGISPDKYIKTYIVGTEDIPVYTDKSLTTRGTANPYKAYDSAIYPIDEIKVYEIKDDWAYVSYPTTWSGWREGYIPLSAITPNNFSKDGQRLQGILKIMFRRPGGSRYKNSSIWNNDIVYTVARSGEYTQIIYPAVDVYKMVWIKTDAYDEYVAAPPFLGQTDVPSGKERYSTKLDVPFYTENDVRYHRKKGEKIAEDEDDPLCLLAAMAMKYSYHTHGKFPPRDIKKKLNLRDKKLDLLSLKDLGYNYLNYHSPVQNSTLKKILQELAYGKPVLLSAEGGEGSHWVIVTGYNGIPAEKLSAADFTINNPEDPQCKTLDRFLADHKTIQQMIF